VSGTLTRARERLDKERRVGTTLRADGLGANFALPVRPEELARAEMLSALPPEALRDLAGRSRRRQFRAGEVVFNEGDEGMSLFVVRRGALKVVRPTHDDRLVLNRLEPGEAFGELAVLNSAPRSASVIAIEDCETIEIAKPDFDAVLDDHPRATRRMLGALARSLTLAREDVARQNRLLETAVRERTAELRETQLEVVRRLSHAAESRDHQTGAHITRMSRMCSHLAMAAGATPREAELLLHAAPMHDVGKIAIPDQILRKPGKLEPEEWEIMKSHAAVGAELLAGSRSPVVQLGELIALTHHERWDGRGYPRGLKGEEIPFSARVTAICDVFDALISNRPYKQAWTMRDALEEIKRERGGHFEPRLVDTFERIYPQLVAIVEQAAAEHGDAPPARGE
jgi:HD-GYP domain-containing protein (c-di-GMP phosphodiesterase class II)